MAIILRPTPCSCRIHRGYNYGASPGLTHREGEPCSVRNEFLSTRTSEPCCCVFQADALYLGLLGFCDPEFADELLADKTAEEAAGFGNRLTETAEELEIWHGRLGGEAVVECRRRGRDAQGQVALTAPVSLAQASEEARFAGDWYALIAMSGFGVRVEDRSEPGN